MKHADTLILISAMAITPLVGQAADNLHYPQAPEDGTVYEVNGVKVSDPYRPLEDDTAAVTARWVEAERALTQSYIDQIPFRQALRDKLERLNNYAKTGLPSREKDGKYYFFRNDGLRNQSVLYRASQPYGEDAEVFIDPNNLSEDGTVALTGTFMSHDGRYTAYTISRSGSDWTEIYVLDTATGQLLDDHIEWAKFTGAQWLGDGFYYSAYPRPEAGKEYSNANEYHKVYYHRIGTPQSEDTVAFENPEQPLHFHQVMVTDDERYLIVLVSGQGNGNAMYVKDMKDKDGQWVCLTDSQNDIMEPIGSVDGELLVFTSAGAPKNRVIGISDLSLPLSEARVVVPEAEDVLDGVQIAGKQLVLSYLKDASHRLWIADLNGNRLHAVELPTFGSVGVSADSDSGEIFYSFVSFSYPSAIYSVDPATGASTRILSSGPEGFEPDNYVTEQVFYPSADGTMIPMFITYRKGLERDGKNPVYLYGYGGFNIAMNPNFSSNRLVWLDNGGIYAQTNLRGGSEYGEDWHLAGTQMQKLNVFNDFIAAAEYMQREGWTTPELTVIEGGSNGGLLVGACTNMRPDLYAVAIPRVGVMDMMRYHLFTIGWNWAHDYGTADDSPEMAAYLLGYSPVHNISNDGTPYPAILVTTADHDDRVVPAHSFKYAAALQAANTGDKPKLIRIDSKAGHGGGKPIAKVIDEYADIYAFIFHNLGITPVTE